MRNVNANSVIFFFLMMIASIATGTDSKGYSMPANPSVMLADLEYNTGGNSAGWDTYLVEFGFDMA